MLAVSRRPASPQGHVWLFIASKLLKGLASPTYVVRPLPGKLPVQMAPATQELDWGFRFTLDLKFDGPKLHNHCSDT